MLISLHPECRGKPARDARINLGRGWVTVDVTWPQAFELITQDGYATSAALRGDHRIDSEFLSRQLVMVDIDSGMTIPELFAHPFYEAYGAGFYVTPSHAWSAHRFRICFVLSEAEHDPDRLRRLNRGLLEVFEQADAACKDPTRLFYGTPCCEARELRDRQLDSVAQQVLIDHIHQQDLARQQSQSDLSGPPPELSDWQRQRVLELLRSTYVGEYTTWRNIGWGLRSGGFALSDFQWVTAGMMREKTAEDAARLWQAARDSGGITMGTVRHFLRSHHGDDCLRDTRTRDERDLDRLRQQLTKEYKIT